MQGTTEKNPLPAEFDVDAYRSLHRDLRGMSNARLAEHWHQYGLAEGRQASAIGGRKDFLGSLGHLSSFLEIGPFDRPLLEGMRLAGHDVKYADHLSTEDLRKRASEIPDRIPEKVPNIDYVAATSLTNAIVDRRFDCVVSCHMVEHAPDLVGHLLDVCALLLPGGVYAFIVPDKRSCFDYYLPESELPDIIAAHAEKRTKPPLKSVIEHWAFARHDFGLNKPNPLAQPDAQTEFQIRHAIEQYPLRDYIDVHCWQFTTESIGQRIGALAKLGFLPAGTRVRTYPWGAEIGALVTF